MKYGRYARVSFTHGVLSIHISSWALSGASHEIGLEGAPFLFPCGGNGRALLWWRREEEISNMKTDRVVMTEIICRAVETLAVCAMISIIGCKAVNAIQYEEKRETTVGPVSMRFECTGQLNAVK